MNIVQKLKVNLPKIIIPHAVVIACFYLVSGGLTELANNIGKLHLTSIEQIIVMYVINTLLSSIRQALQDKGENTPPPGVPPAV